MLLGEYAKEWVFLIWWLAGIGDVFAVFGSVFAFCGCVLVVFQCVFRGLRRAGLRHLHYVM